MPMLTMLTGVLSGLSTLSMKKQYGSAQLLQWNVMHTFNLQRV